MFKRCKTLAVLTVAAVATLGAGRAAASTPPDGPDGPTEVTSGTITVTGTGTARVAPDTALLNLGVQATAPTGAEAMARVTAGSNALTEAVTAAGVAPEDVQTSGLSLWSVTDREGVAVTGYQAMINVNVVVRDLDAVGELIDTAQAAVGEGFTIGGVSFEVSDPEAVLPEARTDAVANARAIAEQYADAAGVALGAIVSIHDGGGTGSPPYPRPAAAAMEDSMSISPGTLELTAQVTITFELG